MIKRLLNRFIALFFSSLISIQCFAYDDVPLDNVVYKYVDGHACAYGNSKTAGDIKLRDKVTFQERVFEDGEEKYNYKTVDVTEVCDFSYNEKITSITANRIKTVHSSAFYGCTSLRSVKLGNTLDIIGEGAFSDCTALEYINLPAGLTTIGEWCFSRCNSLFSASTLKIPNSVTTVGACAFSESGVSEVNWGTQIAVPTLAFEDCINLKSIDLNQTCEIGWCAFNGCTSLKSIAIPRSCTTIVDGAFGFCSALTSVTLHKFLNTIGESAFRNTGIINLEIPEGCENLTIGKSAFKCCYELKKITFLDGKKIVIQSDAFSEIAKLDYLHLGEGIVEIGGYNFNDCSLLEDFELPSTIERIGGYDVDDLMGYENCDGCFNNCPLLTKIDLPANIEGKKVYVYGSFNYCAKLGIVTEAPKQAYEHKSSFNNCPNLGSVVLRKSTTKSVVSRTSRAEAVSSLYDAFNECPELEKFECEFVITGGVLRVFDRCNKLKFNSYHIPYTDIVPSMAVPWCYVKNVTMSESVREIGVAAIPNAGKVTIPDSLRIIHKYAINALEMSEIVLPDSLHTVYEACIRGGSGVLNKLTLKSKIPPVFLKNDGTPYTVEEIENTYPKRTIVRNAESIPLYVPKGTAEAYRNAPGWHLFTEIIEYGESSAIDDVSISAPTVTVEGGRIVVAGSVPVTIFNMSGTMIYNGISERIPALPKGFYIVNAAGMATKVSI